ncbi:MAG: 4Fe-4S dicluster domain-containing protein [Desulfobacteraceae bacterium]|nr:4Fe-4S dicluster domain-containing protein [Desulfobacteraceae bacterium]
MGDKFSATRRQMLKGAGAAGLAAAASLVPAGHAAAKRGGRSKAKAPRWAMVFDLRRCVGCRACTVACKAEYDVPLGVWNTVVNEEMVGRYPDTKKPFLPIRCNHCEGNKEDMIPPCVKDCPEYPKERQKYITPDGKKIRYRDGATYKRPDGLILNINKYCTGCGKCIKACPYGARAFNKRIKSGKDSTKNGITKCTSCAHRIDKGVVPACVNICPGRARVFGDLNDPNSEVSKLAKEFNLVKERDKTTLLPGEDTVPMNFYIDPDNALKTKIATRKYTENESFSCKVS